MCLICFIDCEGILGCYFVILIVCRSCCLYCNRAGFVNGECAVAVVNACNVFAACYRISNIACVLSACCGVLKRQSGFICYRCRILLFKSKACLTCPVDFQRVAYFIGIIIAIITCSYSLYCNRAGFVNGECAVAVVNTCNVFAACYRISNIVCALITACFIAERIVFRIVCYCFGILIFKSKVCLICLIDCEGVLGCYFVILIVCRSCCLYRNIAGFKNGKYACCAVYTCNTVVTCYLVSNIVFALIATCFIAERIVFRIVCYCSGILLFKSKVCLICLIHGQYVGRRKCFAGISAFSYSQIRTDLDFAWLGYCNLT